MMELHLSGLWIHILYKMLFTSTWQKVTDTQDFNTVWSLWSILI